MSPQLSPGLLTSIQIWPGQDYVPVRAAWWIHSRLDSFRPHARYFQTSWNQGQSIRKACTHDDLIQSSVALDRRKYKFDRWVGDWCYWGASPIVRLRTQAPTPEFTLACVSFQSWLRRVLWFNYQTTLPFRSVHLIHAKNYFSNVIGSSRNPNFIEG